MSPLEAKLQERQELQNKGYTDEQILCAALMLLAGSAKQFCDQMDTLLEYADNATGTD